MIAIEIDENLTYCDEAPFYPNENYLELFEWQKQRINTNNKVYQFVRSCIENLGLDKEHYGTNEWNPFSDIIKCGDRVVIKPNLVMHHNKGGENIEAVVTHASVIRPIVDYCLLALKGTGEVIIGDAPQANADFDKIVEKNGLKELVDWYNQNSLNVKLVDFRKNCYLEDFTKSVKKQLPGDPNGYVLVDLKDNSFLNDVEHIEKLYGSEYDRKFIVKQHFEGHKYLLAGSVMKADVIISVPKLKTHRKSGVTINAKNMVGANGDKNYLAHYRVGCKNGGDEFSPDVPVLAKLCYKWNRFARDKILVQDTIASRKVYAFLNKPFAVLQKIYKLVFKKELVQGFGDWHGNDTVWRMCLDLNQIILFADKDGIMHDLQQRKYISIVDGIVSGENDGPMFPDAKKCGLLVGGIGNPFDVDDICIYMMGFDTDKLKISKMARTDRFKSIRTYDEVLCRVNGKLCDYRDINFHFKPQHNWTGFIERE